MQRTITVKNSVKKKKENYFFPKSIVQHLHFNTGFAAMQMPLRCRKTLGFWDEVKEGVSTAAAV